MKKFFSFLLAGVASMTMADAQSAITLDGDFSDWEALVDKNGVAHCVKDNNSAFDYLYDAKFVRDDEFIYFYMDFDGAQGEFETGDGTISGYYAQFVQFFMNCGNEATGCSVGWLFDDPAIDVLIEGSWTDLFESSGAYKCPEAMNGQDGWSWEGPCEISGILITCNDVVAKENGHMEIEGKITISNLPVQPTEVLKIGVTTKDATWDNSGCLPQVSIGDPKNIPGKMVEVPLLNASSTDLMNVSDNVLSTKFLRDGQLFILRGDKTYTITSQEVK